MLRATAACYVSTCELQKVTRECGVFHIWTYKYASCHSGVPFLNIGTSMIESVRNLAKRCETQVFCIFCLANVLRATAACHFWTCELQKVARECGVFHILTYKYASRHSGVQFLNIGTSKMSPALRCFLHFDAQVCFAPQRRAIFEQRNFQNGSAPEVFSTF